MSAPPPGPPLHGSDAEQLLAVLAEALETLLQSSNLMGNLDRAIALIGERAGADRSYIFRGRPGENEPLVVVDQIAEWCRPGITPQIDNPNLQNLPFLDHFPRWVQELADGHVVFGHVRDFPPRERPFLEAQDICSLAVVPIRRGGRAIGFVGFDACSEREWTDTDIHVLRALAAGVAGAMERHDVEASLHQQAGDLLRSRRVALSLMEDAQAAQRRADAANAEKSRFLAIMSHEMRTPLNGILGFAELIAPELEGEPRRHAETIQASGRLLLSLISDLLDFSKIEAKRMDLNLTDGNLREHVDRVLAIVAPACARNGVTLSLEFDAQLPTFARTDFLRYEQILLNLVGNAVKFTPRGSIVVRVRPAPTTVRPGTIHVLTEVQDTGLGIAEDALSRIFEPFSQAHANIHQQFGGTGLGLAICKRLVELLGGALSVESRAGEGSTFRFTTPLQPAGSPAAPATRPGVAPPDASGLKVLVVDDVAANRELAAAIMRRLGATVTVAESGQTAQRLTAEHAPHLILMDVLMPDLDGTETTQLIRARHGHRPWIAALSADATTDNAARCREAGMNFFLTKPLRRSDLEELVREVLRLEKEFEGEAPRDPEP